MIQPNPVPVFVATQEAQGQRDTDFFWCQEGEILTFPTLCDHEMADGSCGCNRSLSGIETSKATTMMKVVLLEGGKEQLITLLTRSLRQDGWLTDTGEMLVATAAYATINATMIAEKLIVSARQFPFGAIVEFRDGLFQQRK